MSPYNVLEVKGVRGGTAPGAHPAGLLGVRVAVVLVVVDGLVALVPGGGGLLVVDKFGSHSNLVELNSRFGSTQHRFMRTEPTVQFSVLQK
jgi:hypothetical protein